MIKTAMIERGKDGRYGIYTSDIRSTIIGEGATLEEAKADFENSVRETRAIFAEKGMEDHELVDVEFEYKYDAASVLNEYDCLNIAQFAKVAGIYPSTLREYATRKKRPSKKQTQKIEAAFHELGRKWQDIRL